MGNGKMGNGEVGRHATNIYHHKHTVILHVFNFFNHANCSYCTPENAQSMWRVASCNTRTNATSCDIGFGLRRSTIGQRRRPRRLYSLVDRESLIRVCSPFPSQIVSSLHGPPLLPRLLWSGWLSMPSSATVLRGCHQPGCGARETKPINSAM